MGREPPRVVRKKEIPKQLQPDKLTLPDSAPMPECNSNQPEEPVPTAVASMPVPITEQPDRRVLNQVAPTPTRVNTQLNKPVSFQVAPTPKINNNQPGKHNLYQVTPTPPHVNNLPDELVPATGVTKTVRFAEQPNEQVPQGGAQAPVHAETDSSHYGRASADDLKNILASLDISPGAIYALIDANGELYDLGLKAKEHTQTHNLIAQSTRSCSIRGSSVAPANSSVDSATPANNTGTPPSIKHDVIHALPADNVTKTDTPPSDVTKADAPPVNVNSAGASTSSNNVTETDAAPTNVNKADATPVNATEADATPANGKSAATNLEYCWSECDRRRHRTQDTSGAGAAVPAQHAIINNGTVTDWMRYGQFTASWFPRGWLPGDKYPRGWLPGDKPPVGRGATRGRIATTPANTVIAATPSAPPAVLVPTGPIMPARAQPTASPAAPTTPAPSQPASPPAATITPAPSQPTATSVATITPPRTLATVVSTAPAAATGPPQPAIQPQTNEHAVGRQGCGRPRNKTVAIMATIQQLTAGATDRRGPIHDPLEYNEETYGNHESQELDDFKKK
ncbi:hypothetical protein GGI19_002817 [Coemansia pectinata]|uniref:Uncharacterized protein n=1 Tax=Coemansia pectinata TaxID=1052879 RepID=A0A9W8LAX0_9FUNG|nr:hypothetical protein GGI19_002817 [Coemansia pectinata]